MSQIEYEISFLNVSHEDMRKKLSELGGGCTMPRTFMRRIVFRNPLNPVDSFARIRDEGHGRITCTFKESPNQNLAIDSVKEIECEVSSMQAMRDIFIALGVPEKSHQESYRETWMLDGVEIALDEWPGLKPFIEIEGENESVVRLTVEKLGFDFNKGFFGGAGRKYEAEIGLPREIANNLLEITFANPPRAALIG